MRPFSNIGRVAVSLFLGVQLSCGFGKVDLGVRLNELRFAEYQEYAGWLPNQAYRNLVFTGPDGAIYCISDLGSNDITCDGFLPDNDIDGYFDSVKVQKTYGMLRSYKSEELTEGCRDVLNQAYLTELGKRALQKKGTKRE